MLLDSIAPELDVRRPGQPIVEVTSVNFSFANDDLHRQILFNVNFQLFPGEIVIVEGPSGCGKTTLLTLICGLRTLREGSIKVFGHEICGAGPQRLVWLRRKIGFIFQQHNLLGFLTARRNVEIMFELPLGVTGEEAKRRSEAILRQMGLEDHLDSFPERMSGGQRQRVAIARALVTQPRLILADEPTAALDKVSGRKVVELLQQLARSNGIPILMVTHDSRILDIADRIIRMEDGRLFESHR